MWHKGECMKSGMYKIIGVGLFIGALTMVMLKERSIQVIKNKNARLYTQVYQEQLTAHNNALENIKKSLRVPAQLWDSYMNTVQDMIAADNLRGPYQAPQSDEPALVKMMYKIFKEYGINPQRVNIQLVEDTKAEAWQESYDQGCITHTIKVNQQWFSTYPEHMQEAFIRHEIMHLLNYDMIEEGYLLQMLADAGYESTTLDKHAAIVAYRQQRELRADLLSACSSTQIAQAAHDHFEQMAQYTYKPNQWLTHPPYAQRVEQLDTLIGQMKNKDIKIA